MNIDMSLVVQSKIGIMCYFEGRRQPGPEPWWPILLDHLVRNGLCTARKRDALLAYPGYTDENTPGVTWPETLRGASRLLGGRTVSTFVRSLHHVKLVHEPGRPVEAKAYLAANHHWHTSAHSLSRK